MEEKVSCSGCNFLYKIASGKVSKIKYHTYMSGIKFYSKHILLLSTFAIYNLLYLLKIVMCS